MQASSAAPRPTARTPPGALAAAWAIFKKDARIERRTGEILATAGVFSILVGFLASLAFHAKEETGASTAAATIWVTTIFAAVLSLGRVWQRERDESALVGLLVSPIPRASIFLGKAAAVFAMLLLIQLPLVLLTTFLFRVDLIAHLAPTLAFVVAGSLGVALMGTLFGAMTVRTRARDLVLAIVLFPLLSPVLVSSAGGLRRVFESQPDEVWSGFLWLVIVFDVVALLLGVALFGALVDD